MQIESEFQQTECSNSGRFRGDDQPTPTQTDATPLNPWIPSTTHEAALPAARVMLVEDHPLVRQCITTLISRQEDLRFCSACTIASALSQIEIEPPDLIVLGLNLEIADGLELLRGIRARHSTQRVLVFSMHDELLYAARCLQAGASGYVMKQEQPETLIKAMRTVLTGATYVSPQLEKQLIGPTVDGRLQSTLDPLSGLTVREREILHLIGQGRNSQQIATLTGLSPRTVASNRTRIKDKLKFKSASQLNQHAIELERDRRNQSECVALNCGPVPAVGEETLLQTGRVPVR
jgi:DNA-binding NarL/FixJ family response regulator